MRVVVDTNVWISALLNPAGPPAAVPAALDRRAFTLLTSEPLLAELAEVLARPRFAQRYRVTATDITNLISLLREGAEIVAVSGTVHLCRDPDDDVVIETARSGRATTMVSRDDDLKRDWDLTRSAKGQAEILDQHLGRNPARVRCRQPADSSNI